MNGVYLYFVNNYRLVGHYWDFNEELFGADGTSLFEMSVFEVLERLVEQIRLCKFSNSENLENNNIQFYEWLEINGPCVTY